MLGVRRQLKRKAGVVCGGIRDQQKRLTRALDLVVDLEPVHLDLWHRRPLLLSGGLCVGCDVIIRTGRGAGNDAYNPGMRRLMLALALIALCLPSATASADTASPASTPTPHGCQHGIDFAANSELGV
jgi:hypothetical protein